MLEEEASYQTLDEPAKLSDVTITEANKLSNHVIICGGDFSGLKYFLQVLRETHLKEMPAGIVNIFNTIRIKQKKKMRYLSGI